VITVGVDLAAEAATTAMATVEWTTGSAEVSDMAVGVKDEEIVWAVASADKLGIDCPLGWPDMFVDFINEHHAGHVIRPTQVAGKAWRQRLAYRATDHAVRSTTGLIPLSVAADRIGLTAMRAAGLLADLAAAGRPVDRSGSGVVVEVYPAASLKCWKLPHRGYKGSKNREVRRGLVEQLAASAPWLRLGRSAELCVESDDALDAVIAALTARAALLGHVADALSLRGQAEREGWIALPTGQLDALL
jgi:predicted nuclease with RNAse H fold